MLANSLAEQVLLDILKHEMEIPNDNGWIRDQNRKIPDSTDLFLIVGMTDTRTYGAVNSVVSTDDTPGSGMTEIQQVQARELIQIDIVSRSNAATLRRWEILAALVSVFSVQAQEKNNFKIFHIPQNFVNSASAEGGSQLNRFSVTVACLVWYRKEKVLESPNGDYYNDFDTRVDDEKTIGTEHGIIEFNIQEEA